MTRGSGLVRRREGRAVVEVLVALLLTGLVVAAGAGAAASSRAVATRVVDVAVRRDAARTVAGVLGGELAPGRPGADYGLTESGALGLRAFRGLGFPCAGAPPGPGVIRVRSIGWRRANPAKDSVLVLVGGPGWASSALVDRGSAADEGCPPGPGRVEGWTLDPSRPQARLLRLYESGEYHLADGAFRYRRGGGGRQPLTAELVDDEASGWEPAPGGSLRMRLVLPERVREGAPLDLSWTIWPREPGTMDIP